ncbi:MAG TPA: Crp/Fnr family transcriptional regulator [Candidatus Limnocylindrales bacterium]
MSDRSVTAAELSALDFFAGLPEATLAELAAVSRRRSLADGETLVEQGQPWDAVHWVIAGRIALRMEHEGRQVLVMTLGRGELLGWTALRQEPLALTACRAVGPAELVAVPIDALLDLLTAGGPVSRLALQRLIGLAAHHLHATRVQLLRVGREGVISAG